MYLGLGINKLHEKVMRETVTSAEAYAYRVAGGLTLYKGWGRGTAWWVAWPSAVGGFVVVGWQCR
jgi:hypothetical protein